MAESAVSLSGVTKRYPETDGGGDVVVLDGLDFEVARGESVAIVGASGSGKSTLLNLIGALDTADAGQVTVGGQDTGELKPKELSALRAEKIGFIFQLHHLLPQLTALENVLLPTLAKSKSEAKASDLETRARELLRKVGLEDRASHRPGQLSGGERQRVAVVRALINEPEILLADEPTGALDAESASGLTELLTDLQKEEGVTLLLVTHDEGVASKMGRVLEMTGGKLSERS